MTMQEANPALSLADRWQRDFPLASRPYSILAVKSGLDESDVVAMLDDLKGQGVLARIGATVRPNTVGASTLAAMSVPDGRLDDVAEQVNAHQAVNHNYEREHEINLWFVVTAANRSEVLATLDTISGQTGLAVLDLPLERSYHIDLGFRLDGGGQANTSTARKAGPVVIDDSDYALLAALEDGLALQSRPYAALARKIGLSEADVLSRIQNLIDLGVIARFGCILRHRRVGFRANAMSVWDVDDTIVDEVAERLAGRPEVTLCYRRARRLPHWPYNLFAMVHGREREAVMSQIRMAQYEVGLSDAPSAVLFSRRCFKQSVARLRPQIRGAA